LTTFERLKNYGILCEASDSERTLSEQHILIDWKGQRLHHAELAATAPPCLTIVHTLRVPKLKNKVKTMTRFYGVHVDDHRGMSDFTIYFIRDDCPVYSLRKTSKGMRLVNTNMFDFKMRLRADAPGSGFAYVHATDNIQETKDNLAVLKVSPKYKQKTFASLADVFAELSLYKELKWIVMRNFEGMPDKITIDNHLDVDLLVNDYYLAKRILDASSATNNRYEDGKHRILNHVIIGNKKVLFDLRSVGDNYYDSKMQVDMLNHRVKHPNGFYIPSPIFHLNSLIYHAVIHKSMISKTYADVFKKYGLKCTKTKELRAILDTFMHKNGYRYVRPEPSVGYNV
jgi:hypothetical protein